MKVKKSKLETLTKKQIESITEKAEKRSDIPLVSSGQVNMRVNNELLQRIKLLAAAQGLPFTTFLGRLISEDIDRLWKVYKKVSGD
jgi:predicted DNA binding CopG/RHH family protein